MIKNILVVVFTVVVLTVTAVTLSLSGQVIDFSGKWIIRWRDNNTNNSVSLTQTDGRLDGTYVNDNKDIYSVSGHLAPKNNLNYKTRQMS